MTVDLRTRVDTDPPQVDPERFLDDELPARFAESVALLLPAGSLRLRPLVLDVDDERQWTLRHDDDTWSVEGGAIGNGKSGRVRLTSQEVVDLVSDQVTPVGLMTAGTLDMPAGNIGDFMDWWLVLRSVLDDRPVHAEGAVEVTSDLTRSFTLDDDPAAMRAFIEDAGYLHIRGVFSEDEMATISADMDEAEPRYTKGDGNSWWATLDDGSERVVRMQAFEKQSAATAELLEDPRFLSLAGIPGCGHAQRWTAGRLEALFKPIGVVQGISDVPWHKDCSLGRHSYECCSLTVGVSVTGAGPGSGQLRVIAGSHRALVWPSLLDTSRLDLPEVALPTDTGDVTVHLSCTLHRAEPPTERERRVLYTGFGLPYQDQEAGTAARYRLFKSSRDNAPLTTSQPSAARG
jgi:hypothetical protein